MVSGDETLNVEKARVERSGRDVEVKVQKKQQLSLEHRIKSETAIRDLTEDGTSLQGLQSRVATVTEQLRQERKFKTETAEESKPRLMS